MFVAGNALIAVAKVVGILAQLYVFVLIGRVICSWVSADPYNPIVRFLVSASDLSPQSHSTSRCRRLRGWTSRR